MAMLSILSIPAIADRLWSYWTNDKIKLQSLLMKMAEREALFERSFAISQLELGFGEAIDESPKQFPLRKNKETNRFEFQHDLAADWARFQRLKEIKYDIAQWGLFANNPLWHNALRMLGQLLLREKTETGTAWDLAFDTAEKSKEINPLAADVLLDALFLDPLAEHYLNERADLLLKDNGARLNRLLRRFHHIATVPGIPAELKLDPSLQLYFEAHHRTPIYGRWHQMAKFLSNYKQKVSDLISPVVAIICETWLTTTPICLSSGDPMPFRREFAEIAIATARALQLAQGKQVMFFDGSEKSIYAAAFAATTDLPEQVKEWALEMARRKPYRQDIAEALAAFKEKKRQDEAERLRTDSAYRKKRKQLRSVPTFVASDRELPPWPLGPQGRMEKNFRDYCLQSYALSRLMIKQPEIAKEIILATIIEDSPKEKYSRSLRLDDDLGLKSDYFGYPTAYWKSPFFKFFQLNGTVALDTLLALLEFCMTRWEEGYESSPHIKIDFKNRKQRIFKGDGRVFAWAQENSLHSGQLHSALAALERWLCIEIDKGIDVTPVINDLLERANSVAIIGVLINIGKYKPELFSEALRPLLGVYELYLGDDNRVELSRHQFDSWAWAREGETIFEMAREWIFAPYRKITLRGLVINLINNNDAIATFVQSAVQKWKLPTNPKAALEFRILLAQLDRNNYKLIDDKQSGKKLLQFGYPVDLERDMEAFQQASLPKIQALTLPYQCEQILLTSRALTNDEAEILGAALNVIPTTEDQESIRTAQAAIASTLSTKATAWLAERPALAHQVNDIITKVIADIGETSESLQSSARPICDQALKFVSYAIMHRWIEDEGTDRQWDSAVLRILTSLDRQAVPTLIEIAHRNRDRLGYRWWRLLQISIFWAGLYQLAPWFNENKTIDRHWARWLRWLRSRRLNIPITIESIDFLSIAGRIDRLKQSRNKRQHGESAQRRLQFNRRGFSGLDTHVLKDVFSWLLHDNAQLPAYDKHERLLTKKIWEFEVWRRQGDTDEGEDQIDELPSDLGYEVLQKLAKLLVTVPADEAEVLWKSVLSLGVDGHHSVGHFIDCWFLEIMRRQDHKALARLWKEMIEFALSSPNWSPDRHWYKGEQMLRQIMGFDSEAFAHFEDVHNLISKIKDLYERWARKHLSQEEDMAYGSGLYG
jgi:hypothetical protein